MMDNIEKNKKLAAEEAVKYIKSGMIIGLGSGTTTLFSLQAISKLLHSEKITDILGIPSSIKTAQLAQELSIPLTSLKEHPQIDLTIDGADEVDPNLNLIKGGGGALLREKIIAQASQELIIIVDETKMAPQLGTKWAVPIEVLPFAWQPEVLFLESLGAEVVLRENPDGAIYKTDQGNLIIDANFGTIKQPDLLSKKLHERAGIIEHGLFLDLATLIIIAGKDGIKKLTR